MSNTSATFHGVKSINVTYSEVAGIKWMTFTLRDVDGGYHDLTAHVDKPIAIEGAELIALMTQPAPEPKGSLVPLLQASIDAAKTKKGVHHE